MTTAEAPKRQYDNTLRRARANETRDRIITAGAELVRESSIRDWQGVTIRGVAERAGVNERTVYRHFENEKALRDAVMQRLEDAVGIDLGHLQLDNIADAGARIFRHVAAYPGQSRPPLDPTLADANRRQHEALLAAVTEHTADWNAADQRLVAGVLDVLWAVGSYERLVRDWHLDTEEATRGLTWLIDLVGDAVRAGERPPAPKRARRA